MKRNKISRQEIIYQIALAGICAGLALFLVWLSVVFKFGTISIYVMAGLVVMLPLTQRYYLSSIFAYVVSALLGFVIAGDIVAVVGYVAYFGPMALLTGFLINKKAKWWLALIIKVLYINGVLALLYFVCHTIMIDKSIIEEVPYWAVVLVGTVGLVAIDYVVQFTFMRLGKVVGKALRKNDKQQADVLQDEEDVASEGESPFEDM